MSPSPFGQEALVVWCHGRGSSCGALVRVRCPCFEREGKAGETLVGAHGGEELRDACRDVPRRSSAPPIPPRAVSEARAGRGTEAGVKPDTDNQIFMWSQCKICHRITTPLVPMSDDTWKFSLGKFLEVRWSVLRRMCAGLCTQEVLDVRGWDEPLEGGGAGGG